MTVDPGARATLVIRLTNRGARARTVIAAVALPPQWRLVTADSAIALPPGESDLQLVQISVPTDAPAASFTVRYTVTAGDGIALAASADSAIIVVPEHQIITLAPTEAPRFVVAGEAYVTRFLVRNVGNAPSTLKLGLASGGNVAATLDSTTVRLAPGAHAMLAATVNTDLSQTRRLIHRVEIRAVSVNDTSARATAVSMVEIVPRRSATSEYRMLPAQLAVVGGPGDQGVTAELRGAGLITRSGKTRLDFLARGPNPRGSYLGLPDEYWINIATRRYRIRLGDLEYSSSRLVESGIPAFGGNGTLRIGAFDVHGFGQRDRRNYRFTQSQQYGGGLDLHLLKDGLVGATYIARTGAAKAQLVTGHAVAALPGAFITAEYGRAPARSAGEAYIVSLDGSIPRVTYSARREFADTGFSGVWRGSSYSDARVTVSPFPVIRLFASASDLSTRARVFASSSFAARSAEGGAQFYAPHRMTIGASYRIESREGFSTLLPGLSRQGRAMRFSMFAPIGRLGLRGELQHGSSALDSAPSITLPYRRWGIRADYRWLRGGFGGSFDRGNGTPISSFGRQDETTVAFDGSVRLRQATQLNFSIRTTGYDFLPGQRYTLLDLGFGQQLRQGHRMAVRTRSFEFMPMTGTGPARRESHQLVEYRVPLSLPVGIASEAGQISAQIVDETGRPLPGVLMRLGGDARVTDAQGRVTFKGLSEGAQYLEVDRNGLRRGQIVTPGNPFIVNLEPREKRSVQLRATSSATIRGVVRLMRYRLLGPGRDTLVEDGSPRGVTLVLGNSGDTARVVSAVDGTFTFSDLHAGRWVLRPVATDLPAGYRLEEERVEFMLTPGDDRAIVLRLIPEQRDVRFLTSVELSPGAPSPPPSAPQPSAAPVSTSPFPLPPGWNPPVVSHWYTVTRFDISLMQIARAVYDDAALWPKIWVANLDLLSSPERMRPGLRLRVPDKAPLTAEEIRARNAYLLRRR